MRHAPPCRVAVRAVLTGLLLTCAAVPAGAQVGDPPPDTVDSDTLRTARDSALARVRQRLDALARPPGMVPDTLPGRFEQAGRGGRGGRQSGLAAGDSITNALMALDGYRVSRYSAVAARYEASTEELVLYGGRGAPGEAAEPDTLPTEEAEAVVARVDSLRERVDSLGTLLTDTVEAPADPEPVVARMDSLRSLADSLDRLVRPGEGEPQVVRARLESTDGYRLEAEEYIRFNQRTELAMARGDPTFTPTEGDPVEADSLNIDLGEERASAFEARTRYAQGGGTNWNVSGDLPYVGSRMVYGHKTRFTSCDLEIPHYHFETDNLKIVQGQILVARPVRLYFGDVPVAWLPFVAQSLASGRASGLLTPRFSVNDIVRTSGGYRRRLSNLGFYWAMSDYTDATVAMDWFDDTYIGLTGSLRFRWLRQFLDGAINFRQYWRENGATEQSLDSRTSWELSERTSFNASIRYASSTDFVRQNSFDPREVTQQITSSGGVSHRFDWGTINVTGNRRQSLSDDKVEMTLPNVSLSMNTVTLFPAPPTRASFYNNMTLSGSAKYDRSITDRVPDTTGFSFNSADLGQTRVSASGGISMGGFSLSQSFNYSEDVTRAVPLDSLIFFPDQLLSQGMSAFDGRVGRAFLEQQRQEHGEEQEEDGQGGRRVDVGQAELSWQTTLSYQQNLIGSTTFTPRLSINGRSRQADTVDVAQSFVSGPRRISFGAQLKADAYGFYPGFGDFEAIRHKLTPSFSYDWSPEIDPTDIQTRVFGSRSARPQSVMSLNLNQTWEAKRSSEPEEERAGEEQRGGQQEGQQEGQEEGQEEEQQEPDTTAVAAADPGPADGEPRRLERGEIVNLLSINTSAIRYDFVEADSVGQFLAGFQNTTLRNQISSDILRGFSVSITHDLFEEDTEEPGEPGDGPAVPGEGRSFDPHLKALNFDFSLNARSEIFRWIGLGGGDDTVEDASAAGEEDRTPDEPFDQRSATDETTILPGQGTDQDVRERRQESQQRSRDGGTDWRARFGYSLNRPRAGGDQVSQMLTIGVNLNPTSQWEMSWDTAYDLEEHAFNDHRIRLTRDLHRWQAHFDFLKTTTGNWSFRFEVSLLDNQDLKFDYEQRNVEPLAGSGG